jgi:hypothetical protein
LAGAGYYNVDIDDAIDGNFDPILQKALRDWTAAGCP